MLDAPLEALYFPSSMGVREAAQAHGKDQAHGPGSPDIV